MSSDPAQGHNLVHFTPGRTMRAGRHPALTLERCSSLTDEDCQHHVNTSSSWPESKAVPVAALRELEPEK